MYALEKFQLNMPNAFGVTLQQSSYTRKINLYSKHWENKSQALTKTVVTLEYNTEICIIVFAMDCWVSYFFYYLSSLNKGEIYEEKLIMCDPWPSNVK